MPDTIYHMPGVGEVLLERSRRARRLNISVRPFKGIRVAVPVGVSYAAARAFADSKKKWLHKHLAAITQLERRLKQRAEHFEGINRAEARQRLSARLNALAQQHGFRYRRLIVRNQKTRWGSCSATNHISLNMKLVRLPEALMDYIILHELVHTRIKNHGRAFYRQLDRLVDDRESLEARLKAYDTGRV